VDDGLLEGAVSGDKRSQKRAYPPNSSVPVRAGAEGRLVVLGAAVVLTHGRDLRGEKMLSSSPRSALARLSVQVFFS